MEGIGIIKKLSKTLPQHSLITIYKPFMRTQLNYGDIIMKVSIKKLKQFSAMLLLQLQLLSKYHLRVNYIRNMF